MSFFNELKRRNVFRVGIAYIIAAWLVMQFADVVLNNIEAPPWVFQAIMLSLGIGLLFAIFFAWAFELTPEGIKKEKDVDRSTSITPKTGRKLDFIIIGILVVALGYFAVDKFVYQPAAQDQADAGAVTEPSQAVSEAAEQSIAVLPFVNMSDDAANEYFSDGITEEILNVLARISELKVAGRTSSFAFKGQNEDLRSIGEKLNVKTLLEGSVRKDDARQKVRVTVQLINVEDGYHIWSQSYDRSLEDIFAIQEEIASEVATALKINLLGELAQVADVQRSNLNAYEWYLKGLSSYAEFSLEGINRAIEEFRQSITLDPDYLPAQLELANSYLAAGQTGFITLDESIERADLYLKGVLQRDPENDEALAMMGILLTNRSDPDFQTAEAYLRTVLDRSPRNLTAIQGMATLLLFTSRATLALDYARQAAALEPYSTTVQLMLATVLNVRNNFSDALETSVRIREIEPDSPLGYYTEGLIHQSAGQMDQMAYWVTQAFSRDPADPELPVILSIAWLTMDDLKQAEQWADKAAAVDPDHPATLGARIRMLLAKEMYSEAEQVARKSLALGLQDRWGYKDSLREALVGEAMKRGDAVVALSNYKSIFAEELNSATFTDERTNHLFRLNLAQLELKVDSASAATRQTIQQEKDYLERVDQSGAPNYWRQVQARIAMLEGNHDNAIAYLREAFDHGGLRDRWRSRIASGYLWADLHRHPGYQEIVSLLEAEGETQRENAYKLLASLE